MSLHRDKPTGPLRSRNGVTLPGDVLKPGGRTLASDPDRGSPRRPDRFAHINWPWELARICVGLLGILFGLVLIMACAGMAYLGFIGINVLRDIAKRDYSTALERIDRYTARFDGMESGGYRIQRSEPKILNGETSYLWVVTPAGSDDRIVYRWKHYLKTNNVEPMTNAALLLDVSFGFISPTDATAFAFYNPQDKLAQALAQRDFSQISPDQIAERWTASELPMGPVLAPLMSPEQARSRSMKGLPEEEVAAEDQAAAEGAAPGEATEVGEQAPPAGGDGDSSDVGGGRSGDGAPAPPEDTGGAGDGDGGGQAPPDDDAVPVG
jgi:hypothetical protein